MAPIILILWLTRCCFDLPCLAQSHSVLPCQAVPLLLLYFCGRGKRGNPGSMTLLLGRAFGTIEYRLEGRTRFLVIWNSSVSVKLMSYCHPLGWVSVWVSESSAFICIVWLNDLFWVGYFNNNHSLWEVEEKKRKKKGIAFSKKNSPVFVSCVFCHCYF